MFGMRRRWLVFFLTAILPALSLIWGLNLKLDSESVWNARTIAILVAVLLVSLGLSYLNVLKPVRDVESGVKALLEIVGGKIIAMGEQDGIEPRLNILLCRRPARWFFFRRYLWVAWSLKMRGHPDVAISFPISKGVAGEAFRTKRPKLVNLEETGVQVWGITPKEAGAFPELTAIYSVPIFEIDKQNEQTGRVIGTVNLDSRAQKAFRKIARNQEYKRGLEEFSELASKLCS